MNGGRIWRRGMDQLSAWLPVGLMLLLAAGSWWLVRNAPEWLQAGPPAEMSQQPDYYMHRFSVRSFDAGGRLKSELVGTEGHHYPATDTLEVLAPHVRSYDEKGHPTVATARRGESNADASEVKLFGDAYVVREPVVRPNGEVVPRLEYRGEFLHAFIDEDRVSSDKPVELTRGSDRFTGDALEYNNVTGEAVLTGRVRGVLHPAQKP